MRLPEKSPVLLLDDSIEDRNLAVVEEMISDTTLNTIEKTADSAMRKPEIKALKNISKSIKGGAFFRRESNDDRFRGVHVFGLVIAVCLTTFPSPVRPRARQH